MANSPNGGLINETNEQYYVGTQSNIASSTAGIIDTMVFTFNEVLSLSSTTSWDPTDPNYNLNNFVLEWSVDGLQAWNLWNGNPISGGGTGGSNEVFQVGATVTRAFSQIPTSIGVGISRSGNNNKLINVTVSPATTTSLRWTGMARCWLTKLTNA